MLWSPLDKETKYKAKNTLDVPVYRGADALGAQANAALGVVGVTPNGVMVIGAAIAALWGLVGWWLGRRFENDSAAGLRKQREPVQVQAGELRRAAP
jgi:AAA family ATP:ADP antiporter